MIEYRCSQCKTVFNSREYRQLDTVSRVTDDPTDEYGVETVCSECGARFHSDKWHLDQTVEVQGRDIRVSTVALPIPHGFEGPNLWYETCIFLDRTTNRVVERYETEVEAAHGHAVYVNALTNQRPSIDLPNDFALTLTE